MKEEKNEERKKVISHEIISNHSYYGDGKIEALSEGRKEVGREGKCTKVKKRRKLTRSKSGSGQDKVMNWMILFFTYFLSLSPSSSDSTYFHSKYSYYVMFPLTLCFSFSLSNLSLLYRN